MGKNAFDCLLLETKKSNSKTSVYVGWAPKSLQNHKSWDENLLFPFYTSFFFIGFHTHKHEPNVIIMKKIVIFCYAYFKISAPKIDHFQRINQFTPLFPFLPSIDIHSNVLFMDHHFWIVGLSREMYTHFRAVWNFPWENFGRIKCTSNSFSRPSMICFRK